MSISPLRDLSGRAVEGKAKRRKTKTAGRSPPFEDVNSAEDYFF
jgi:hypothetical protein